MSNATTRAKAKWNTANYIQIKVSAYPEIADAFKAACKSAGVSMASELSRFMAEYSAAPISKKAAVASKSTFTKKKRRNTVRMVIRQLEQVRDAEEQAMDNTPDSFRESDNFAASEESLSKLEEAIGILEDIY